MHYLRIYLIIMTIIIDNYLKKMQGAAWMSEKTIPDRRHSKKRDAILELVRSTKTHPSAQWVHEQLKAQLRGLSLGTVYRNIKVLIEEGALASAGVVNGEERFDGEPEPHPHAVCKRCGLIIDLPEDLSDGSEAAEGGGKIGFSQTISGFSIDIRHTVFYGLCSGCTAGGKSDRRKETAAMGR